MQYVSAWCEFLGAWLLVAGPLYQAALELHDEDIETERIKSVKKGIQNPQAISIWWWLVPPIKVALEQRRSKRYRRAYLRALSEEDANALVAFISKATGWLYVATGGLLLAVAATYQLMQISHYPIAVFWVAVIIMPMLSVGNVIYRVSKNRRILQQ